MQAKHLAQVEQKDLDQATSPLQTSGDHVLYFISKGKQHTIYRYTCKDFLTGYLNWQDLMSQGVALYMCEAGHPLEADSGILCLLKSLQAHTLKQSKAEVDLFSQSSHNQARVKTLREQIAQRVRQSRSA